MSRFRRRFFSIRKDESGATAIEFGLVAIPFFLILFGIVEVGLIHMVNRMLDNAVIEASRMIRTGQAQTSGFGADDFEGEICNSLPAFLCNTERIVVVVDQIDSFSAAGSTNDMYDADGDLVEDSSYTSEANNSGEIVVVNVVYRWPMITSLLSLNLADHGTERHLTSTLVFRNEPWE
ncbi:TadE-like protein [Labrenzia sp. THAF82]|uniref:TadE/TadG family type IV pilus assembly protein n=1 Tax=Labrenzia sp. THAF82 TaxID=2587861 RepID=UPI0012AA79F7|nr:TadE/TadG family type IV pilus assembly protein [Labrenzia sp. THAF82]QFT34259.1 TadE-like protein [Labrenzia sp. THAF82]